jgi:hypothetical protein
MPEFGEDLLGSAPQAEEEETSQILERSHTPICSFWLLPWLAVNARLAF